MVRIFGVSGRVCLRLLAVALAGASGLSACAQVAGKLPFQNPALATKDRVDDLVKRMTLEEKATQLVNQARAIPRLGVPAYDWWSESLHGLRVDGTTQFPEPIGLAATFDTGAIHTMAEAISTEGRIRHVQAVRAGHSDLYEGLDFWAPNINIFRDPRWGRGQETYGEDPFLTARMGVAFVTGMQGDDPKYLKTISTPKHFAVHSGPETTRHTADVRVSRHDEMDTYLPAFRATVVEGKAGSVMCAYNSLNGQPACANEFLLQEMLRGKWGFQGYVVSDCGAVIDVFEGHHFTGTQAESTALALRRGMDNECVDWMDKVKDDHDYRPYLDAVKRGLLKESEIDIALKRLFTARMRLGMFDPPEMVPYSKIDEKLLDSEKHRALARKLAEESMVLLKNDGALPLKDGVKKIAVVGPLADQTKVLMGNYNGVPTRAVSVLDGLKAEFPGADIQFVPGTDFLREEGEGTTATDALVVAQDADVIVAVVGITSELEGEEMKVAQEGFKGGDRTSLDLPKPEEDLLEAVSALGKPLVVVLMNGSALGVGWAKDHANAIVEAWYSGEEGGAAVAETLSGKNNPAGRLPVTFYKDVSQLPPFEDYSMAGRTYRYFEGEPLFPFGYGLSYTKFRYSGLELPAEGLRAGDGMRVEVTVANAGDKAGDEVVQLYLEFPKAKGTPLLALRGFKRVHLEAGARQTLQFDLKVRDVSMVNEAGDTMVEPGAYRVFVGGGQPGGSVPGVSGAFVVSGEVRLPD